MTAISCSSWPLAWIGLEINLIAFIPLMLNKLNPHSSEAAIKYFLIQAFASLLVIISRAIISSSSQVPSFTETWDIIAIALGVKTGIAPMHIWFPQVIELTEWIQSLILLTWQKIAPIILISYTGSVLLMFIIVTSAIIGRAGGFNVSSLKKILTYSSIAHLAWIASIIGINEKLWILYFLVYSLISFTIITPLIFINIKTIVKINLTPSSSATKTTLLINVLSLAGLPPFLGFTPKVIVIFTLLSLSTVQTIIALILISSSVITLFYYLRIFYSSIILFSKFGTLSPSSMKSIKYLNLLTSLSVSGNLILVPLVLLS